MFILDIMCGTLSIPEGVSTVVSLVIKALYIGIPVLLIVWGILDLGKSIIAQKEDEIKKHRSMFFKRLISAILVYFVAVGVIFIIGVLANAGIPGMAGVDECINKLIDY